MDGLLEDASRMGFYEASVDFLVPNPALISWVTTAHSGKCFLDLGCGRALLGHELSRAGMAGLCLDIFPSREARVQVYRKNAALFEFAEGMLPMIARPSRGGWIRRTITAAVEGSGCLLYIGKPSHYDEDLAGLPYHVTEVLRDVGECGEHAWMVTKEDPNMNRKRFDRVLSVRRKLDDGTYGKRAILVGLAQGPSYIKMHWDAGATYGVWSEDQWEIVKEWPYEDEDDLHAIWDQLDDERTPEPAAVVTARLGFINPEGHFYPCAYCAHKDLGKLLQRKFYPDSFHGWDALDDQGWARIMGGGLFVREKDGAIPEPMLETFGKLIAAFKEAKARAENFNQTLTANPEGYSVQSAWSTPDDTDDLIETLERNYQWETADLQAATGLIPPGNVAEVLTKRLGAHPGD